MDCFIECDVKNGYDHATHTYLCKYCNKSITRAWNLAKHLRLCDKYGEHIDPLIGAAMNSFADAEKIYNLSHKNRELLNQIKSAQSSSNKNANNGVINNGTNNGTINNTVINIVPDSPKLVTFGEEDLDRISDSVCVKLMERGFESILLMAKYVHLNNKFPEYQNVYVGNETSKTGKVFKGNRWASMKKDEIFEKIREKESEFLIGKFEEIGEELLNQQTVTKMNRFINECNEDDYIERVNNDLAEAFYEARYDVKENRKKIENAQKKKK
jgi:hypothetical protein